MGLFDIFKPKKDPIKELYEKMSNQMFPKGQKDIDAGTKELLLILNNKISFETAQGIFLKSMGISFITKNFDEARLRTHLAGYCLHYFSDNQVKEYFDYLNVLNIANRIHRRTPSEVKRQEGGYIW
jgi:hypothetical protein